MKIIRETITISQITRWIMMKKFIILTQWNNLQRDFAKWILQITKSPSHCWERSKNKIDYSENKFCSLQVQIQIFHKETQSLLRAITVSYIANLTLPGEIRNRTFETKKTKKPFLFEGINYVPYDVFLRQGSFQRFCE